MKIGKILIVISILLVFFPLFGSAQPTHSKISIDSKDLFIHYKLDEDSSNTTYDSSGNNIHGRSVNALKRQPGSINYSYYFNGTAYIDTNILYQPVGSFSISFWFKHNISSEERKEMYVISNNRYGEVNGSNRGIFMIFSGDSFRCAVIKSPFSWIKSIVYERFNDNNWHFASLVFRSGESLDCYIDGTRKAQNSVFFERINMATSRLQIGRPRDSDVAGQAGYIGYLDDIRIYNRSLSDNEVKSMFNKGESTITTSLSSHSSESKQFSSYSLIITDN